MIRRPHERLAAGAAAIGGGDLGHRIGALSNDEFGDLAHSFDRMVEQLQATTVSRERLLASEQQLERTVAELRQEIADRERAERQRLELQAELVRSEKLAATGQLVTGVAHEVRNPLFGISSTLDAMEARFGAQAEQRRYFEVLRHEVERLNKLMNDLLHYARPPAREFAIGQLGEVIALAIQHCRPLAEKQRVALVAGPIAADLAGHMERARLEEVFQNLIDNAIWHSPVGSRVEIVAVRHGGTDGDRGEIECVVTDEGPGIAAGDLPRLFDPFFSRRRGGTGLGLSIARRIVEEHGGSIAAANRPGGGCAMTVTLPQERRARIRASEAAPT